MQVPDGTIASRKSNKEEDIFLDLAKHEANECKICKRVIEHGIPHTHKEKPKMEKPVPTLARVSADIQEDFTMHLSLDPALPTLTSVIGHGVSHAGREKEKVKRPIPVSARIADDEDNTVRPSQDPALALARVIKVAEEEHTLIQKNLKKHYKAAERLDPSMSHRKREDLYKRIAVLQRQEKAKATQIYNLYDVLEDQKNRGKEMTQEEVEVTILKFGVDLATLGF